MDFEDNYINPCALFVVPTCFRYVRFYRVSATLDSIGSSVIKDHHCGTLWGPFQETDINEYHDGINRLKEKGMHFHNINIQV